MYVCIKRNKYYSKIRFWRKKM